MFPLPPPPALIDPNIKVRPSGLTEGQLKHILDVGDRLMTESPLEGHVGFEEASAYRPEKRTTRLTWMHPTEETGPIFTAMGMLLQEANAMFWNYDLWGFFDAFQYTVYDGARGDHFEWHEDRGDGSSRPQRKLSLTLLLTDPTEYDGGDFEIFNGGSTKITAKDKGTIIIFPSFIQHRVTPVTRGIRKSLVGWCCGPKFR